MKIGVIGSGVVATTLGSGFLTHGHEVVLGTRESAKLEEWAKENPKGRVMGFAETAAFAEIIVLAVKGTASLKALRAIGAANLAGKIVIDATNPIAEVPPVNGVLSFFTSQNDSLMEQLQREFGGARFVKAFNSVGAACMINPQFEGGKPTMFLCGNDAAAKQTVTGLLDQLGWVSEDTGAVESARAVEALCMLWCIAGFRSNDWVHAYKVLR
jgi:predicted dinucleotide-binding enzyme